MTNRQIETSRELRLWLGQIFIPAAAVVIAAPEIRTKVVDGFYDVKRKIKTGRSFKVVRSKDEAE